MSNSFFPPQIGFVPSGQANTSSLYLGQNAGVSWEAVGFGPNGRPDVLETVYLNLSKTIAGMSTQVAQIALSASGVQTIITAHANAGAAAKTFQIREVDVCDAGVAKKMLVIASATYSAT